MSELATRQHRKWTESIATAQDYWLVDNLDNFQSFHTKMAHADSGATSTTTSLQLTLNPCQTCAALEKLFTDDNVEIQLPASQVFGRDCTEHVLLFQWIKTMLSERLGRSNKARTVLNWADYTILFFRGGGDIPWIWIYNELSNDTRPFVALSYRWGSSTSLHVDKDTFSRMASPGSISTNNAFLTPTVRDAIYTVRAIGERYLWVDAICLSPQNDEQLAEQLQLMGGIYASAKLTIVALDGDASTGLRGLKCQSSSRSLSNIFPWKDGKSIMVRHLPALSVRDPEASEYFQRGWTFQEYILSQRRLIFGDQQIHWQCPCATLHEDRPDSQDQLPTQEFPNIKKGWPDVKELNVLLNEYNSRELTHPEDAFPAVNGLLTYLENYSFELGFLFGLPRAFFSAALMWCNRSERHGVKTRSGLLRRQPSKRRQSILPSTHLPSWSWIGWQGDGIGMLDTEAQFTWSGALPEHHERELANLVLKSVITIPITRWYNHASPAGPGKRLIPQYPTVYKEHSEISYDKDIWEMKGQLEQCHIPTETGGKRVYEHTNFPGRLFLWPLQKMTTEGHDTMNKLEQNPFISCRTQRAWFGALQEPRYVFEVQMHTDLCLFDRQKRLCGWLQLPNDQEISNFPEPNIAEQLGRTRLGKNGTYLNPFPKRNKLLELVAICIRKYPDLDINRKVKLGEFYGVLWVEWMDGVAYRRGCGCVQKRLWDEQDVEDVDLILG
ncbi:hypothetical protein FBEOM_12651 [Fusarium beomiforme]|uniref:Heterokaryon incompatibility domain-containing protein n=1 Tax=Fusarium beomiforme TaxID=44412 RepID=A0A9P5DSU8_9HYPO|nr:hypothetical protein FBEOM_12651 [Fusarium beomiforme]